MDFLEFSNCCSHEIWALLWSAWRLRRRDAELIEQWQSGQLLMVFFQISRCSGIFGQTLHQWVFFLKPVYMTAPHVFGLCFPPPPLCQFVLRWFAIEFCVRGSKPLTALQSVSFSEVQFFRHFQFKTLRFAVWIKQRALTPFCEAEPGRPCLSAALLTLASPVLCYCVSFCPNKCFVFACCSWHVVQHFFRPKCKDDDDDESHFVSTLPPADLVLVSESLPSVECKTSNDQTVTISVIAALDHELLGSWAQWQFQPSWTGL